MSVTGSEVNELRMTARWKLGRLLAAMERGAGPGRGKKMSQAETSFRAYIASLKLDKNRAQEAQRIGTLPEDELRKSFAAAPDLAEGKGVSHGNIFSTGARNLLVALPLLSRSRDGNMRLTPTEEFLRHANECRLMAKSTRISEDKAIWTRMADRWQRCADWFEKQTMAAHAQSLAAREAASDKPHGRQHRYLTAR